MPIPHTAFDHGLVFVERQENGGMKRTQSVGYVLCLLLPSDYQLELLSASVYGRKI
jgi:hypothetical protein